METLRPLQRGGSGARLWRMWRSWPGIFEGFARNQDAADTLEAMEDPELEGEIREAVAGWRASPTGRAWNRMAAC
jgi:hypothetical protein